MKLMQLLVLLFSTDLAWSQSPDIIMSNWQDSLELKPSDSIVALIKKADSITLAFQVKADSLNGVFERQLNYIENTQQHLQQRLDNLQQLQLPTESITQALDSLKNVKHNIISDMMSEFDSLKAQATSTLQEINLPPQLQEPLQKLQASITEYSLPALNLDGKDLPALDLKKLGSLKLPTLTDRISLDPNLKDITANLNKVQGFADQAGIYVQDAQSLVKGNLDEVKSIDKALENKLTGMEGLEQLTEGKAMVSEYSHVDSAWVKEKAKALVQEQVAEFAQNHFEGKQEVLKQAMDKMSKLKGKYSEVKSLAELPKRAPNPLKGKPLIERLLPGISFQIQKSDYFLLDVNPYLMYLITPRFSAGAGWNYRLPFDDWRITKEGRVYGPRAALEVKWTKGINFRLLPELMNTAIPALVAQRSGINDPAYREWVPSVFVGIKKDFTVYTTIKGNTEVLFNLYDKDGKSPYSDRLSIRFGFEFPMRDKRK